MLALIKQTKDCFVETRGHLYISELKKVSEFNMYLQNSKRKLHQTHNVMSEHR